MKASSSSGGDAFDGDEDRWTRLGLRGDKPSGDLQPTETKWFAVRPRGAPEASHNTPRIGGATFEPLARCLCRPGGEPCVQAGPRWSRPRYSLISVGARSTGLGPSQRRETATAFPIPSMVGEIRVPRRNGEGCL